MAITEAQARAALAGYCGWHVAPVKQTTARIDSDGDRLVWLPTHRVQSIDAVKVDGKTIGTDDFEWSEAGLLRLKASPPAKLGAVEVTMTHGYESDVLAAMVAAMVELSESATVGATREQAGPFSIAYDAGATLAALTPEQRASLDVYRLGPRP